MTYSQVESFAGGEDRMVSIKVKVQNKDNRFGGRNVDISFGSSSFKTPNRTATPAIPVMIINACSKNVTYLYFRKDYM